MDGVFCRRFLVSGRVQGVFYRASTRNKAEQLQLYGFVRNLPDGRVEVLACGDDTSLVTLQDWLWQGPPGARVDDVAAEQAKRPVNCTTFKVV